MSHVTGIVLCCSVVEDCPTDADDNDGPITLLTDINKWIAEQKGQPWEFSQISDRGMIVCNVAINNFYQWIELFAAFVIRLPWRYPEEVVLIITPEGEPARVYRPEYSPQKDKW